jgi:hypothetical protein
MTDLKPEEAEARFRELQDRMARIAPGVMDVAEAEPGKALIREIAADLATADARFRLSMKGGGKPDVSLVPLMCALFAAGRAMRALSEGMADVIARQINEVCEYGETAEMAADWLGGAYSDVLEIADEMAALLAGPLAAAPPERDPVPPPGCRCEEILADGGDWADCPVHAEAGEPFVTVPGA